MTSLLAKSRRDSMPAGFFITGGVNRRDSLLAVQSYVLFLIQEVSPMNFSSIFSVTHSGRVPLRVSGIPHSCVVSRCCRIQ